MKFKQRINAFVQLGRFLGTFSSTSEKLDGTNTDPDDYRDDVFYNGMLDTIARAKAKNGWFTKDNIDFALSSWSKALSRASLEEWCQSYSIPNSVDPKTVAIVMAGNIPLVGLHDFISVLLTGNKVLAKLSSNDNELLPYLTQYLISIEPEFELLIEFTEGKLENFDAVIATGSNNTARYFEHYFGKYPNIIRRNRNSVAVLTGTESKEDMTMLADDVFRYFGLGCRNVSKIFIPKDYNFDAFFNGMFSWKDLINNDKYINNYDYNKAVYLMSRSDLLDNEFMLLKEDEGYSSPISVVFYEYYENLNVLQKDLEKNNSRVQCIVSKSGIENEISFGKAQTPDLWDYADGVDTLNFLLNL